MIRKPNNWENVKEFTDTKKLPVGAYVCMIKTANIQESDFGFQLCMAFDIIDGEYAGYYTHEFESNTANTKKWKGVLRYFLPRDDGSQKDEWTKSSLKGLVTSIEQSNRGYTWNWDETSLSGKLLGIIFRNEEWAIDGKQGWATRPFRACSVDTVQDGTYTIPKDKPLNRDNNTADTGYVNPASFTPVSRAINAAPPASNSGSYGYQDDGNLPF